MLSRRIMKGLLIVLILGSFVLVGCSKLSTENYEKLKVGMTYEEVVGIIGAATDCSQQLGVKSCTWGSGEKYIKVKFAGDKAVYFSNKGIQ